MTPTFFMTQNVGIFRQTQKTLNENPIIWVLFFFVACCDFIALLILYTAPFGPHAVLLGPIIRTLWSERYLHYPENFVLLPKLMYHAHVVILLIVGIIITGIVIKKVEAYRKGEKLHSVQALKMVLSKYLPLAVCWWLTFTAFNFMIKKGMLLLPSNFWIRLAGVFFFAMLSQALLAYLIPAILLSKAGLLKGIKDAFVIAVRYMRQTLVLIVVPVLVLVVLAYVKALAPFLVRSNPESVLWLLALAIPVTMVADLWISVATTLLFLKVKGDSK